MDVLATLQLATDEFIAKRLRQNKPFQSLIATDNFDTFKSSIESAIKRQMQTVADNLPTKPILDAVGIDKWLADNLPPFATFMDKATVADFFIFAFEWGVRAQYRRFGLKTKMAKANNDFELTNQHYIDALNEAADYLLNLSSIDPTTKQNIISLIQQGTLDGQTMDEVADLISESIPDLSDARAFVISRTETARAMGQGNYAAMTENGVEQKKWVPAGSNVCAICEGNADDGYIAVSDSFSSGDDYEPAHPNCECYTEAGEIDLDAIDIWGGE